MWPNGFFASHKSLKGLVALPVGAAVTHIHVWHNHHENFFYFYKKKQKIGKLGFFKFFFCQKMRGQKQKNCLRPTVLSTAVQQLIWWDCQVKYEQQVFFRQILYVTPPKEIKKSGNFPITPCCWFIIWEIVYQWFKPTKPFADFFRDKDAFSDFNAKSPKKTPRKNVRPIFC